MKAHKVDFSVAVEQMDKIYINKQANERKRKQLNSIEIHKTLFAFN